MTFYLMKGTASGRILIDEDGKETADAVRPEQYLVEACLRHGSTMEGREIAFRYLTKSSQKAGVLVNQESHEFWFPTLGKNTVNCEWVAYFHVVKAFGGKEGTCEILFDNGMRTSVNCSSRTIQLQLKRCHSFLQKINENS